MARLSALVLSSAVLLSVGGCRPLPMYTALEVPQRQVTELRNNPEVHALVADLAREGAKSAASGLADPQTTQAVRELFSELTKQLVADLRLALGGALEGMEPRARQMGSALVSEGVASMSTELPRVLGPALRGLVVRELMETPEFKQAVGDLSEEVGKRAVLGANAGLTTLGKDKEHGAASPLGTAGQFLSTRGWVLLLGGVVLLLLVPIAWLARQRGQSRRTSEDSARRSAVAAALLASLDAEDHTPATRRKMLERIAETLAEPAEKERSRPGARLRHA